MTNEREMQKRLTYGISISQPLVLFRAKLVQPRISFAVYKEIRELSCYRSVAGSAAAGGAARNIFVERHLYVVILTAANHFKGKLVAYGAVLEY